MATKILGTYRIDYPNGISQVKNLISHDDFLNIVKPKRKVSYEHELLFCKHKRPEDEKVVNDIADELREYFGEYWFTDKSPIYDAIEEGEIELLTTQGNTHKVTIIKL